MLRNPIYVRADSEIYGYFADSGVEIGNPIEDFIGYNGCYLYSDKEKIGKVLVLAPHEGIVPAHTWLQCRKKRLYPSGN